MPFHQVGDQLNINGVIYRITEHPIAPGMSYVQEGRSAAAYQLVAPGGEVQAIKLFKPRHCMPTLPGQAVKVACGAIV